MLRKRLIKHLDNKGFSLVELIVVVLIIAIIAVALAPQVMKWVGTSKINVDIHNAASLKSAVSAGVADFMASSSVSEVPPIPSFIVNGSIPAGTFGTMQTYIDDAVNHSYPKSEASNQGFDLQITTPGGVIVKYYDPATSSWIAIK